MRTVRHAAHGIIARAQIRLPLHRTERRDALWSVGSLEVQHTLFHGPIELVAG